MVKQIIVIGGGSTFDTYSDYIFDLKNKEITLDKLRLRKNWKDTLSEKLGKNFDVLLPRMPDSTNAKYKEWKIWFKRIIPFLKKNVIFIGHSLGGIFLAKYLSENTFPKIIKATLLVAAPFDDKDREESLSGFRLTKPLNKFAKQGGTIYLFHSKDDPVVPFGQLEKYKNALPNAKTVILDDRSHFNQEFFPELVHVIKVV